MSEEIKNQGAFNASVARTPKEIRESRGAAISEDGEIAYKRAVEDQEYIVRKLKRDRAQMMDISPSNSLSYLVAREFDAKGFQEKDMEYSMQIRNESVKLAILKARYEYLFGNGAESADIPEGAGDDVKEV